MTLRACINRELSAGYYAPQRFYAADGSYVRGTKFIPHTMTRNCRHEGRATDPTCGECKWREVECS